MEIMDISKKIQDKIGLLEDMRLRIKERAERKATAISNYDKALAITIIKLKNGKHMELDNNIIEKPPTTIIDKIAKGVCYKEKLEMEEADALYKCVISNINSVLAELNAYQSIFRHLEKA